MDNIKKHEKKVNDLIENFIVSIGKLNKDYGQHTSIVSLIRTTNTNLWNVGVTNYPDKYK